MDCLEPPLLEIPQDNWYCDDCFDSSDEESDDDPEEVDDLNNDIEDAIGDLPGSRLRNRPQQPQILRTLQSERIRNAILARMSLRSTRQALGEGPPVAPVAKPRAVRKRRATRRRRARTVVVEYDVDGSDKFAMRSRRVKRRKVGRRRRKAAKATRRSTTKPLKTPAGPLNSFKSANPNIYELQRGRMKAGLSNFNIFQPTNQLDYVPDEEDLPDDSGIDDGAENSGGVLTQAIISLNNPQRRNLMIKNRVLQNCTTTSNAVNLLDSIMQDQDMFGPGSIRNRFAVEKSSGKLLFVGGESARQCSGGDEGSGSGSEPRQHEPTEAPATQTSSENAADLESTENPPPDLTGNSGEREESQNLPGEFFASITKDSPPDKKKKPKKPEIDMFDENSNPEDDCPNFSIYDSVDAMVDQDASNSFQIRPNVYHEENVDMVQMSDESSQGAPPAIVASQPASPDLENDTVGELMPERSYTPPIAQKTSDDGPEDDDYEKRRKERESRRNRKREVERYNVRDRLKDRSPLKLKDKFGRNRSRSSSRKRQPRRRTRSPSRDRNRRSRSHDRNYRKSRSLSRSRSRRRTPSLDHDRKKKLHKERARKPPGRRSRSKSFTPRHHRPTTPDRRVRSKSKKAKKKRYRDHSKEKPSTMSKEVFTSGPNILVSVNFNNQDDKAAPKRSRSRDRDEPKEVVDITARKKITISSKPVAIIDLARSPFRELTPEYQSNVIELSDSEGEKTSEKQLPKSPDSTISSKLYDPFDILNSPSNENVTSSQNTAALSLQKPPEKVAEPVKPNITYNKNIMALAVNSSLFFNEENLVTSSSSMVTIEKQPVPPPLATKVDVLQHETVDVVPMDIVESPYSPGHEYDDTFEQHDDSNAVNRPAKAAKGINIFDELFGSSTPPGLDRLKNKKGKIFY